MSKNGPEDTIRDGSLKASIWRNEGDKGPYFTANFARTYKDDQGNLQDAQSFNAGDLLRVSELARQAHHRTNELRREAFKEQRTSNDRAEREPSRRR